VFISTLTMVSMLATTANMTLMQVPPDNDWRDLLP